jgi:hypothetical protein
VANDVYFFIREGTVMLAGVIIISLIGAVALLATIIGITLHDVRLIKLDKEFHRHPYARRWRKRPIVSIVINKEPSSACMASIRKNNYRKLEIVSNGNEVHGELLLSISSDTVITQTAISQAVRQFNANPSMRSFEIIPVLESPQTIREFFRVYHRIALAPFVAARAGLGVTLPSSSWPLMTNLRTTPMSQRTRLYLVLRWLAAVANLYTLVYAGYIAVVLYQPEFLLMYLAAFGFWLLWAISRYQQLRFRDKLIYLLLAPASLIYFVVRSLVTPLRFPFGAIIRT